MCITYKKRIKRKGKWFYKIFRRDKEKLVTCVTEMPVVEDTGIWQKARWSKEEEIKSNNLAKSNIRKKHLGKISVYKFKNDAEQDCYADEEEIWKVEVRDEFILEGVYDFSSCPACLVDEFRLDKQYTS